MAPKGLEKEHRVSQLGTGKEMQKLRERTVYLATGGGAFRLSPHIKSPLQSGVACLQQILNLGGVSKKGLRDKTWSPSLLVKTILGSMGSFCASMVFYGHRCRPVTVN